MEKRGGIRGGARPDERRRALLRWACIALWALAVLSFSFWLACQRSFVLNYNPVNGDWQSYNAFRRVLAGQAPYADFANYVGMAPLVLNLPFLWLNGSFAASMFATNFTCNIAFCLCVLAVFWLATRNLPVSLLASALGSKLVSAGVVSLLAGPVYSGYFTALYQNLYTPSNSMRIARLFWPFALALGWLVAGRLRLWRGGAPRPLADAPRSPLFCAGLGALAGLGVTWSNDFGLAAAFAALVGLAALLARLGPGVKTYLRNLGLFLAALAAGAFLSACLVTGGRPLAYFRFTFGVGQTQYFYFNGTSGRALLPYVFTNTRLLLYTLPYAAFLVWCLVRLVRRRLGDAGILAAFLALSVLAGSYAYVLSGSGYNFTEALEGFFWLGLAALLLRGLLWLLRRRRRQASLAAAALLCVASLVIAASAAADVSALAARPREGAYFEQLGGYSSYIGALRDAAEFTAGGQVFSVYATGLEAVKGQFQPSGFDYIIHALGDEARAAYLENFKRGNYPFAQTMNLPLESWLCLENWDFYRLLAAGYKRAATTEYSWLWTRTEQDRHLDIEAEVTMRPEGAGWVVEVSGPPGESFVADVKLSYKTRFTSPGGALLCLGRRCVAVGVDDPVYPGAERVWGYFAAESDALYLPVTVENGYGSAVLSPCDAAYVQLELENAQLAGALPSLRVPAPGQEAGQ